MGRRRSIPPPLRTEVSVADLKHLDVLQQILSLLNEPAASATALAREAEPSERSPRFEWRNHSMRPTRRAC